MKAGGVISDFEFQGGKQIRDRVIDSRGSPSEIGGTTSVSPAQDLVDAFVVKDDVGVLERDVCIFSNDLIGVHTRCGQ
jgi:hypothetical protein